MSVMVYARGIPTMTSFLNNQIFESEFIMNDLAYSEAEEKIRKEYLGKTCLSIIAWVSVVGFAIATWALDWNLQTKGVILNIAAYSSIIWGPWLMYNEWRGMRKELKALNGNRDK